MILLVETKYMSLSPLVGSSVLSFSFFTFESPSGICAPRPARPVDFMSDQKQCSMPDMKNESLKNALMTDGDMRTAIYESAIKTARKLGWHCTDGLEALYLIFAREEHLTPNQLCLLSQKEILNLLQVL